MPFTATDPQPPRRRVVITGAGIISPMGIGWGENATGFRSGHSAIGNVTLFDTSRQRTGKAGQVNLPDTLPAHHLTPRQAGRLDRATAMLLHAGSEALASAAWTTTADPLTPLVLGTSAGAMQLGEAYYRQLLSTSSRRGQATRIHGYQPQNQAHTLTTALGLRGPATIITNACASGANALGHAADLVATGRAKRSLAGGYDALCQLVFAGFDSLQALSPTVARPFDKHRDGLALGEGAALFTIEPLDAARRRGATVIAEIVGYGATTDVHHLTQPHPGGDAALASMDTACAQAGITARDIGYINSHGTGTPLNDVAEGHAIQRWAGDHTPSVSVSSTKGAIGHLLGGAGAVESAISLMALTGDWIPPCVAVREPDPVCTFDLVTTPRDKPLEHALTNSFGFGGANATLVFRKIT
ncbi:MAG: beta-ketoacyl-[acyl-carrier-protein] synthase family protein [Verrucomicrobiales bacterium]|nr:beta-ketoacyl-[acyl-carrier-protein] synthase family protein [Verrucomicrobiales bacterium]